ncbi:MAG: J domain-containing protein [Solirubrobacteraceae bacterium]
MAVSDPYKVLGIPHSATDAEIRAAYRRQVQLHHPDHNGGSQESARKFEQVQDAYALIRKLQRSPGASGASSARRARSARPASPPPPPTGPVDPGLEARLAEMDRELKRQREAKRQAERNAQRIREDALRQAREAARADSGGPSDEDLGYVTTDDSFTSIFEDAAAEWSKRRAEATQSSDAKPTAKAKTKSREEPVTERLADLFDGWGARLRGEKQRDED